jgi:hypothetical protein
LNIPSASRIALTGATAAAALVLTACSGSGSIEHGTVKEKRGHGILTVPETNCRKVKTSNAFTISLSGTGGSGGSSGRSSSSGSGRSSTQKDSGSRSTSKSPKKGSGSSSKDKPKDSGSRNGGTPATRRVCDPRIVPARWELLLQDGKRTDWKRVSKDFWDDVEVGDKV